MLITPATRAALFSGAPGWVTASYGALARQVSACAHYDEDRYYIRGRGNVGIDDFQTCTRASVKYVENGSGLLIPVAANRSAVGYGKGGSVEEARTNLALRSQTFANATWSKSQINEAASAVNAPDGTTTASTLTPTAGGSVHDLFQALSAVSGTYSESVWMRAGTNNFGFINLQNGSNYLTIVANLATGAITQTAAAGTAMLASSSITAFANGWYRINLTGSLGAAVAYVCVGVAGAATGNTFNAGGEVVFGSAAGTETIHLWGFQLELGAFPTSYIPTTTASVSRAAENIVAAMPWINSAALSLYGKGKPQAPSTYGINQVLATLDDGTATNRIGVYRNGGSDNGSTFITPASFDQGIAGWTTGVSRKIGISTTTNQQFGSFNGVSAPTPGAVATPTGINRLSIGQRSAGSTQYWNGYIERLAVLQVALSQGQLNALTQ